MKKARVLLADRHPALIEGIRTFLEPSFDIVGLIEDEKYLMEAVETLKPDLAIVNLSMPGSKGTGLAKLVQEHHPATKVILLSVYDDPVIAKEALAQGASGFVLERSVVSDLIPAIREVLSGRSYISPDIRNRPVDNP